MHFPAVAQCICASSTHACLLLSSEIHLGKEACLFGHICADLAPARQILLIFGLPDIDVLVQEETSYATAVLADTEGLQDKLYKELRGRIQEEDQTAAQRDKGYFRYSKTLQGKQYKVICRRKVADGSGPPSGDPLTRYVHVEDVALCLAGMSLDFSMVS